MYVFEMVPPKGNDDLSEFIILCFLILLGTHVDCFWLLNVDFGTGNSDAISVYIQ